MTTYRPTDRLCRPLPVRPLMSTRQLITCTILCLGAQFVVATEAVPYGHPDFYPSAERPAQLRGDETGQFPAATPVTEWDFRTKKNIIWAVRLPGWGYGRCAFDTISFCGRVGYVMVIRTA